MLPFAVLPVAALAAPAPAPPAPAPPAKNQPAMLKEYSSRFVQEAVLARKSNVSPAEASSVASVMVNKGLQPTQFTQLALMGEKALTNLKSINPTSLNQMANVLASAYTSMHAQPSYSSYIQYVKQHTTIFDDQKMRAMATAERASEATNSQFNIGRRQMVEMYGSLMENSEGRHAIETFTAVMQSYMKDFGVEDGSRRSSTITEFIYNLI